jgi:UDP-N-acetylglucosamine acyltransferase
MTTTTIHPTAVIAEGAKIHPSVEIAPYAVIGPNVEIKAGTKIGSHVVLDGYTTIGEDCNLFAGVTVGLAPQDLSYKNEPTGVVIGDRVTLREYVTIHRGTGDRFTRMGNDCFIMTGSHVAHDCQVGNNIIMANSTILGGHVKVGDGAVFAGVVTVHQHCRIGRMCMVGGMSGTRVDLPPFCTFDARPAIVVGFNVVGMRRNKIGQEVRTAIKQAYKYIYSSGLNTSQALEKIDAELPPFEEIKEIVQFIKDSKRGFAKAAFGQGEEASEQA